MPHRKNAKGDIGTAKKWSDSYDADNIYLTEEGWAYRHFKNLERTRWWDEILVAGQVKPGMSIGKVNNGEGYYSEDTSTGGNGVCLTNPLKFGVCEQPGFETGDGVNDYRYTDHAYDTNESIATLDRVVIVKNDTYSATGFDQIAWEAINVSGAVEDSVSTQIPDSWTDVSSPKNTQSDSQPPYPGEDYVSVNQYTLAPQSGIDVPPPMWQGYWENTVPGSGVWDSSVGGEYNDSVPTSTDDSEGGVDSEDSVPATPDAPKLPTKQPIVDPQ